MNPKTRYDLCLGEWRPDPPRVSYDCGRSRLVEQLPDELSAGAWTKGESDAGKVIEVRRRMLRDRRAGAHFLVDGERTQ